MVHRFSLSNSFQLLAIYDVSEIHIGNLIYLSFNVLKFYPEEDSIEIY